jgi:carboxyl-terminal processing protease
LQKQGAKKFILDLRNSGFGKPEYGVELADLFLDKGLIAYSQGQKTGREDFKADPQAPFKTQPLVLITNRGTANAAELAAAALLDSKRAEIVGERTYGDAAIRRPVTMEDGSAVILSVAKFHSPSGKAIQDTGVTPTVMVTETEPFIESEDEAQPQPEPKKQDEDELLKKAVEVLTKGKDQVQTSGTPGAAKTPGDEPREKLPPLTEKEQK